MARLNEPPSSESLESLKRRFIRQNRELARSNSTQSVKIRNLETHISQLIANNVSLRATVIQLQSELDGSRTRYFTENIDAVKRKLEEKLQEVGGLVAELSGTKTHPPKKPKSPARSPSQKLWKTNAGIGDTLEGREGWLPTITEGKYFPRRTLDPIEIADLAINGSSDSPDIGPPPQISIDGNVSPANRPESRSDESARASEDTSMSSLLSSNLETRRRRRESNVRRDSGEGVSTDGSPSKESNSNRSAELWTTQPIRAGAKRKLDVANRPGGSDDSVKNRNSSTSSKSASTTNSGKDTEPQKSPARKALAPKSVNTDPVVSPKKAVVQEKPQDGPTQKQSSKEASQRSQMHKAINSRTSRVEPGSEVVKSVEIPPPDAIKLEPKTPAPFDLLSPLSTEPSESRPEGRGDTPPPANLTSLSVIRGENAAGGRGSRRARASVNYAEPNLISKMRRPTKELVNAVWQDQSRATSASAEPPETLDQTGPFKTVVIKSDNSSNDDAKGPAPVEDNRPEPKSPLDKKDEASKEPAFDRSTARDRRRSALHQSGSSTNTTEGQTTSSAAISALVSGSRRSSTATENGTTASLEDTLQKLDIYDVAPSPPRPFTLSKPKDKPETTRPSSAASVRSTGSSSEKRANMPSGASASSTLNKPKSRRQTVGTDKGDIKSLQQGPGAVTGVSRDREVKPSRSDVALSEKAISDTKTTAERVAERTAARRRSMML